MKTRTNIRMDYLKTIWKHNVSLFENPRSRRSLQRGCQYSKRVKKKAWEKDTQKEIECYKSYLWRRRYSECEVFKVKQMNEKFSSSIFSRCVCSEKERNGELVGISYILIVTITSLLLCGKYNLGTLSHNITYEEWRRKNRQKWSVNSLSKDVTYNLAKKVIII